MTQSRWMPIGVLALLLSVVPVHAQSGLSQIGSALAIGQEAQDQSKCPCCVEIDVECCQNPITFLNRILATWLRGESNAAAQAQTPRCADSTCPFSPVDLPQCPVAAGTTTECVECPLSAIMTATGNAPIACGIGAACTTAAACCDVCPARTAVCVESCCGANCKCCDSCKCKKVSKCKCCKNCECSTCGSAAPVVFRCPFLSQIHVQHGHPMMGRSVQVIHQGMRPHGAPSPVLFGQTPNGHPWPIITEFHPPIPVHGALPPVCPWPTVVENRPHHPHMPVVGHRPHPTVVAMTPAHPGRLVSNSRPVASNPHTSVRIQATPKGVLVEGAGLKARCNRIAYNGKADVVELQGNVQLEYRRGGRSAKIVAERVVVHLREGSFEVTPAPTTGNVVPTTYNETVDVPETLPRPTPSYTQPRRFPGAYPAPVPTNRTRSGYETRSNVDDPTR